MRAAIVLSGLAALAAAGGAAFLAFVPVYQGVSCRGGPAGEVCQDLPSKTLAQENGTWVLLLLAVPVLLTLAQLSALGLGAARAFGWAPAVCLAAACAIAIFSIGVFFLPAALLALAAALADRRGHPASA